MFETELLFDIYNNLNVLNFLLIGTYYKYSKTIMATGFIKASGGSECYTGDGPIMRRKSCPVADFSDMCFKKIGGKYL